MSTGVVIATISADRGHGDIAYQAVAIPPSATENAAVNLLRLCMILRLAILYHHIRGYQDMPEMAVEASQDALAVTFPDGAIVRTILDDVAPDSLPDYEILELLLFLAIPRRDVKPIAKDLITKFKDLYKTTIKN